METALHVTNGDSAAKLIRQGGVTGDILPWRDVLHDGPVPLCANLSALSEIRARFISKRGWANFDRCLASFQQRDTTLAAFTEYDKVCLWFEHDLYDQLQILQILAFLNQNRLPHNRIELICVDRYLGLMDPQELAGLHCLAKPVSMAQYALATSAWRAFSQPEPQSWGALLQRDLSSLPFLRGAVIRMLEEYPAVGSGVSRTERQTLEFLRTRTASPRELFIHNQSCEQRIYLGDSSYWIILQELMAGARPLIQFENGPAQINDENKQDLIALTEDGRAVLEGTLDRMTLFYPERWIGGNQLHAGSKWRWDASSCRILLL